MVYKDVSLLIMMLDMSGRLEGKLMQDNECATVMLTNCATIPDTQVTVSTHCLTQSLLGTIQKTLHRFCNSSR